MTEQAPPDEHPVDRILADVPGDPMERIRVERAELERSRATMRWLQEVAGDRLRRTSSELMAAYDSHDQVRIGRAQLEAEEAERGLLEHIRDEDAVLRRLEYLTTEELSRESIAVTQAAKRAAWATFWVALFAMIASTTATIVAAFIAAG